MKKITAILLSSIMLISLYIQAYGYEVKDSLESHSKYFEFNEICIELSELYVNDSEFFNEASERNLSFDELIAEKVEKVLKNRETLKELTNQIGTNAVSGNLYYANVKLIEQTLTYNCGPTSILQILYGLNRQSSVSGSTDAAKITQLSEDVELTTSGAIVWKIVREINNYAPSYPYDYYSGNMGETSFKSKLIGSLTVNAGPILHAKTGTLSYYNNYNTGHYIAVSLIDSANNKVTLQDCFPNSLSSNKFGGTWSVTLANAYSSISSESGRYLICLAQ